MFKGNKKLCAYETNKLKDWLYVLCIILRVSISLLFILSVINFHNYNTVLLIIFSLILVSFIYKFYLCAFLTWKNYLRFILLYTLIVIILIIIKYKSIKEDKYYQLIGVLILLDALFGMTSKFNFVKYLSK